MRLSNNGLPTSDHFELRQIADGVYDAIAIEGRAAFSNAGFYVRRYDPGV